MNNIAITQGSYKNQKKSYSPIAYKKLVDFIKIGIDKNATQHENKKYLNTCHFNFSSIIHSLFLFFVISV